MTTDRFTDLKHRLFDKYYEHLNPEQRRSIYSVDGPTLILAGAGSGKTTVLVNRLTHILRYGNGYNIHNVQFEITDQLCDEMEEALLLACHTGMYRGPVHHAGHGMLQAPRRLRPA